MLRIGALEAKLGNSEQAWEAYARAFTENPESTAAREALENLAAILDSWASLVTLYEGALGGKKTLPPPLERELLLVVAVAYDEKLEKSEKAVEYFRRAQAIEPEDASALVALERLYTRTERWSDLIDTLTKKFALVRSRTSASRSACASPPSGRRCSTTRPRRSRPGRRSSRTTPRTSRRCARSIACTCARVTSASWATTSSAS